MVRTQQNILISSVNRTSGSEGTSDFTVRLDRPIEDVVRTDLRELIVMYTPPVSSPYTEGGSYVVGNVVSYITDSPLVTLKVFRDAAPQQGRINK